MQFKVLGNFFKDYGLKKGFQQISISTQDFFKSFTGKATATIAVLTLAYKAIDYLQSGWTRAGEAAEKATSEFQDANSELESLKSQKADQQTRVQEIAAKYDIDTSELQNADGKLKSVDEMIAAINSHGGITLVDQAELDGLSSAGSQLEAQLAIQEQVTEAKKQAMIHSTEKAAGTEKTYYEQMKEEHGSFKGFFKWIQGQSHFEVDEFGNEVYKAQSDADKFYGESGDSTELGLFKARLEELKEYKAELKSIDSDIIESKKNGEEIPQSIMDRRKELVDSITNSSADLGGLIDSISADMEVLSQSDSDFAVSWVSDAKKALNDFNTIDLSGKEKQLALTESYFNGSKVSGSIKDSIMQMLKSGEADSATDALHRLGVTLNDLGITGEGKKAVFDGYFDNLIASANEAENAVKGIDGSAEGVQAAFATENQDSQWNSMSSLLSQADELYKQGKVGTDDFKAAAQFMSPDLIDPDSAKYDADAYAAAWEAAYDKVQRYFNAGDQAQSVENFTYDLVEKDLADDADGDITWKFKSTAEAADALGLSIEAAETAMHNLEAYGAEFDDVMFSGEGLKEYETTMESLKSLYQGMDDSSGKDRLKEVIEGSEEEDFANNLENLTEEHIVKLKFEYDLASLQQEIDDLKNGMLEGGSTQEYAALISAQKNRRDMLAEEKGLSDAVSDEGYTDSLSAFDNLAQRLVTEYNTLGEEGRRSIQQQQSAILDLQNTYLDMFQNGDIADWESFLNTESADEIISQLAVDMGVSFEEAKQGLEDAVELKVDADTSNAESKVDGILGKSSETIVMEADASTEQIQEQLGDLQSGQSLIFTAEVNGSKAGIEAIKNEDGTIYYSANVDGVQVPVSVTEKDGDVTFNADTKKLDTVNAETFGGSRTTNYLANLSALPTFLPPITRTVSYVATGAAMVSNAAAAFGDIVKHEEGTLLSPSHVNGTAYHMSNLKPAYAGGKVALSKDEYALVNELGTESLIRNGVWSLLPGKMHIQSLKKGDIILNAAQTRDLIKSGRTDTHARAYAGGTLLTSYANGFRLPPGITNNSSYTSSLSSPSYSSGANTVSSAASSMAQAAEDLKDFIEIYLDQASDLTQRQIDAIDRAAGLADKQNENAKAVSAIQSEITKNRQAYDRYMQQANSVGLSEAYASQIRDGSLNIESITDETLSKNIKSYEEWYRKAKDCLDKVTELQDKERELAIERLEQIEDFYKLVTDVHEALQDANDAKLEFSEAMGFSAVSDSVRKAYQESLAAAEEIYQSLSQQLTDYQLEFSDLIAKGYIQKYSDEWYEGYAKIHEFNEALDSAGVSVVDFEDKIREITYTKIQQLIDGFERAMDKLDARIDLMESRDEAVPEDIYQKQIDANNSHISGNKQMRDAKLAEQALYAVDSKRYQELAEDINKLDTETLGLMEDNEKLKDTIFKLRFTPLEDGIDKMESLRSELKNFMGLLNDDTYFGRKGELTSEGAAALALLGQSMSSAKQEIADYRKGLDKLQESLDNNVISQAEFDEKSEDYRKGIRDSIGDVQDYSEALTKLYLNQMKQENKYLQEIIDKRKDALKAKEEYYDYDKKLRSQSKDVNMLKSQIAALEGVNNTSAQAELRRLKEELADAEDKLSETKRSHAVDMQEEGYHAMSDELDTILSDTEYEIIHSADKQQSVIRSMLQNVVSMYSSAYGKINEIIHNTGWAGSAGFQYNQSELGTQEGASNQVSNAVQHQTSTGSSGTAQGTVTAPVKNNDSFNQKFEQEIYQDPNINNRPVAELKLSQKSVTLEEGKSTSVSAQIRPTDAKNKTLSWKSSDERIASVSGGTIRAIKPGSCQVTASTTDGSGISASIGVTVTKKPDPPKPVVNTPASSSGGDGVPRVGDVVTLLAGQRYYYSSWGTTPAGNLYAGVPGGVIIDGYSGVEYGGQSGNHGDYGIHIRSADGRYSDLGWVSLSQITGYSKGTRRIPKDGLALFDETASGKSAPGSEVIVTKYGTLKQFDAGDTVFDNKQVKRLYEWSKGGSAFDMMQPPVQELYTPAAAPTYNTQNVEMHFDQLVTITDSTITKDSVSEMKGIIKDSIPMIQKEVTGYLYREGRKKGMRRW
ncbi:MAG: Ig-like domain-containing protein [Lachnospiraceae bacterium]